MRSYEHNGVNLSLECQNSVEVLDNNFAHFILSVILFTVMICIPYENIILNSDSQQFYQYQQYKQVSLDSNHRKQKSPRKMTMAIQFMD